MAMFENFPYTDLHNLNLDWIIKQFKVLEQSTVLSVNGQTGQVVLYQSKNVELPSVPEDNWTFVRLTDGTMRGIYFGRDNIAYVVHGNDLEAIYSANNQPPYPVTSVNGQTGNITLYEEEHVELPELTDEQKHNWNIFRYLNNIARGIQFDDEGKAYLIDGVHRYPFYTSSNPPPYPVTSVNGKTGTVSLFTDNDGTVEFPSITDEQVESWLIQRTINGNTVGIEITETGSINLVINDVPYTVYTENNPPAGFVTDDTTAIMQTTEDTSGYIWGLIRETDNGTVGFIFNNTDNTDPDMFIRYTDNNNQVQTLRLLTEGDIPSTGVYSINGQAGVVTLYGVDIDMSTSDNRSIPQAIEDVKKLIAIIENTDIATHNIPEDSYVIWKNDLYTASSAIVIGDTLTLSNLTPSSTNVFEEINKLINKLKLINISGTGYINTLFDSIGTGITITGLEIVKTEFIVDIWLRFEYNQAITVPSPGNTSNIIIGTLNSNFVPASYHGARLQGCDDNFKSEVLSYGDTLYLTAFRASENGYTIPANTTFSVQGTYITDH